MLRKHWLGVGQMDNINKLRSRVDEPLQCDKQQTSYDNGSAELMVVVHRTKSTTRCPQLGVHFLVFRTWVSNTSSTSFL